ncbi:MAG: DUF6311 domain-containing protein [Lachnospiraceae bacterium]|nr:DUF6311 domain-containing protein [Lachnospiraceae bacterium]
MLKKARVFCKKAVDYILNNESDYWFIILSGFIIGTVVYAIIYGLGPLNVLNDAWIMKGYDEPDLIQHYAGWCAYRYSGWHFPIGLMETMGGGTIISYTDSIPLVAVFFKIVLGIFRYNGTFQYFGIYTLICYILQAIAAGLIVNRKSVNKIIIVLSMIFMDFCPILMERAMRHTALGSQFLILFAIYLLLKGRDGQYKKYPWGFYILGMLSVSIHPYFLPLVMIFALIYVVEAAIKKKGIVKNLLLLGGNVVSAALIGFIFGALGGGVSASRDGYGFYSMNLNAPINPTSCGGYIWSSIFKVQPQILGNYDGFNYFGLGYLSVIFLAVICILISPGKVKSILKNNWFLLLCMVLLTVFAVSNVITYNDKELLHIPLPEAVLNLCGIFRASSRMFYAPYYVSVLYAIYVIIDTDTSIFSKYAAAESGKKTDAVLIIIAICFFIQLFDIRFAIIGKHQEMNVKLTQWSILNDEYLNERLSDYPEMICAGKANRDIAVLGAKHRMKLWFSVANSGDYSDAKLFSEYCWEQLKRGNHGKQITFVTTNLDNLAMISLANENIEIYYSDERWFIFPNDAEENNKAVYRCIDRTDDEWIEGVNINNPNKLMFGLSDELKNIVENSSTVISEGGRTIIKNIEYTDECILITVESEPELFAFPNFVVFE